MGYLRTMGAGGVSTSKLYGNANINGNQGGGNKLQGLPPLTGMRRPHRIYKRKAGGQKPGRDTVFCINQLGGMMVKNSQFAANADGVKECSNRKNQRHHGHERYGKHHKHHSSSCPAGQHSMPDGTCMLGETHAEYLALMNSQGSYGYKDNSSSCPAGQHSMPDGTCMSGETHANYNASMGAASAVDDSFIGVGAPTCSAAQPDETITGEKNLNTGVVTDDSRNCYTCTGGWIAMPGAPGETAYTCQGTDEGAQVYENCPGDACAGSNNDGKNTDTDTDTDLFTATMADNMCPLDYPYAYDGQGGVIKKTDGTTVKQPQNSKGMWCCSVDTDAPNICIKGDKKGKIRKCSETEWVTCEDYKSDDTRLCTTSGWDTKWKGGELPESVTWQQLSQIWNEVNPENKDLCVDAIKTAAGEANPACPPSVSQCTNEKVTGLKVHTINTDQTGPQIGLWQVRTQWVEPVQKGGYNPGLNLSGADKTIVDSSDFQNQWQYDPCRQAKVANRLREQMCSKLKDTNTPFCSAAWTGSNYDNNPVYTLHEDIIKESCSNCKPALDPAVAKYDSNNDCEIDNDEYMEIVKDLAKEAGYSAPAGAAE